MALQFTGNRNAKMSSVVAIDWDSVVNKPNVVLYEAQALTDSEQEQARENIGAVGIRPADLNVADFGAESGGSESALNTAFQAAINALPSGNAIATGEGNGGAITVPPGDYSNLDPASLVLPQYFTVNWDASGATLPANMPGIVRKTGVFPMVETSFQSIRNVLMQNYYDAGNSIGADTRHYVHHVNAYVPSGAGLDNEFRAYSYNVETNEALGTGSTYGIKGRVAGDGGSGNLRSMYAVAEANQGSGFTGLLTGFLAQVFVNGNSVSESVGIRCAVGDGTTAAFQAQGTAISGDDSPTFAYSMRTGTGAPILPITAGYQSHGGGAGDQILAYASNTDITAVFRVLGNSGSATDSGAVLTAKYLRVGSTSVPANTTAGDLTAVRLNLGTSKSISGAPTTTLSYLVSANGGDVHSTIDVYKNAASVGGFTTYRAAQGTSASPTALQTNDTIGGPTWRGYGATAFGGDVAGIIAIAAENWTDAAQGSQIDVQTTAAGSVTPATCTRFIESGGVTMAQYLRVGSLTAPANASAGVITGTKLSLGNTALGTRIVRIQGNLTGGTSATGMEFSPTSLSDVTSAVTLLGTIANTEAAAFALSQMRHFSAVQGTIGAGSSISQQWGFYADSSLTGATSNMGFYGNIAAAANRWNVYMNGTARNYMAGALSIGATTDPGTGGLFVNGGVTSGSATLWTTTVALTNGAAAGAGTLSNAPVAGNPTKWIPINDNGTTRYIPAW